MDRKKLIKKKFETILRIQDWYEKLQKEKDKNRQKEIENTIRQLEENLIELKRKLEDKNAK